MKEAGLTGRPSLAGKMARLDKRKPAPPYGGGAGREREEYMVPKLLIGDRILANCPVEDRDENDALRQAPAGSVGFVWATEDTDGPQGRIAHVCFAGGICIPVDEPDLAAGLFILDRPALNRPEDKDEQT